MSTADTRTAADLMTASPRTCSPFSSVLEAVMMMRDADCGAIPIVDDGKPTGILTDRDVALAVAEFPDLATRSVADVMTKGVVTIAPETSIAEIEAKFADHGIRRLVVVNASGVIAGIITWADIVPHESEHKVGQVVTEVLEQP